MEVQKWSFTTQRHASQGSPAVDQEDMELKRGPWTVDEDLVLVDYIAKHGEGRWNSLARHAGLKRTGKSCRLRWLNYLRPDVRRGNLTAEEQLLILELHSRWGNRWSKIAQYLPGRTDNEIKNYWRTRVQKHAKQLNCDVGSKKFKDAMRHLWMPRLVERIRAAASRGGGAPSTSVQDNVDRKVPTISSTPAPHSPLESSDVDDPLAAAGSSGPSAGTLVRWPSPESGCLSGSGVPMSDDQDAVPWAESLLNCSSASVPQILEDQTTLSDQLRDLDDEWGLGDMFVDNFWSFEDIWSMEQGML